MHPSVLSGRLHGDSYHSEEGGSVVYSLQTAEIVPIAAYTDYSAQSDYLHYIAPADWWGGLCLLSALQATCIPYPLHKNVRVAQHHTDCNQRRWPGMTI